MHRLCYVLTSLAVCAAPAWATPVVKKGFIRGGVPTLGCTLQVDFGSAATGPNLDAWQTIRIYIADSRDIYEAEAWGWGKEGEFSVCLRIDDPAAKARVLDDLSKLISAAPVKNGAWTKVGP
jgi:hypothetical protein